MADQETTKLIRIVIDSSRAAPEADKVTAAWRRMEQQQASTTSALERMEKSLGSIASSVRANLALQIGQLIERFVAWGKEALKAAEAMGDMAAQMGVSVETMQALQYSAAQSGVSFEQLQTGIAKFQQRLGEAANGNKDAIDGFNRLGVKILDVNGNMKPTETNLTNVARAIQSIQNPAQQTAAAVENFGKTGARYLPMFGDMAEGIDALIDRAKAAGVVIPEHLTSKLKEIGDRSEVAALKLRAVFVTTVAPALIEGLTQLRDLLSDIFKFAQSAGSALGQIAREQTGEGLRQILSSVDQNLARQQGAVALAEADYKNAQKDYATRPRPGGGSLAGADTYDPAIQATETRLNAARSKLQDIVDQRSDYQRRLNILDMKAGPQIDKRTKDYVLPATGTSDTGGTNPTPTGSGGESPEDKYRRLQSQLDNTAAAQDKMTAAALAGDQAFDKQKAQLDAQNKLLEIFKVQLDQTNPKLQETADKLLKIAQGKAQETFAVATTELQKQNTVLEAQNRLFDAAPEIQAKEIAAIKAKQEMEKTGLDETSEKYQTLYNQRRGAIEQNVLLTQQQTQLKQAQDLWTEPLKQALRDIQTLGANAFEQLLESGNFSFQSLAQTFTTILKKMAAEFLALATIRPIMSVLVSAIGATGLLPQSAIAGLGYGSSLGGASGVAGSGGGGSLLSGLGLGSFLGSGSGGGILGSIGGLLKTPVSSLFSGGGIIGSNGSGLVTAADLGVGNGAISAGGITGGTGGLSGAGGVSIGGALGAGVGILGGAYQLATSKGIGNTIGGISSMVGGAVSLIPGFGQIAGPIIAIGGNILGSLIGNGTPQPVNSYGTGALNYGSGGFGTSGGTYGANANQVGTTGALGQAGQSIQAIFNALGGVKDQSRVYGLQLQSFNQQYADGSAFNNQTSYIVGPDGSRIQWGQGSNDKDIGLSTAAGHIAAESIMGGAVGQISDNLKRALSNLSGQAAPTLDDIASLVTQVKAFDDATKDFGHTVSNATKQTSDALDQIENSFSALYDVAAKYGLDTSGIDQQKALQLQKYGSDFAYSVNQSILGITDPRQASLNDLAKERQGLLDQNAVMVQRIAGYADQTVKIEEYAAEKRVQITRAGHGRDGADHAAGPDEHHGPDQAAEPRGQSRQRRPHFPARRPPRDLPGHAGAGPGRRSGRLSALCLRCLGAGAVQPVLLWRQFLLYGGSQPDPERCALSGRQRRDLARHRRQRQRHGPAAVRPDRGHGADAGCEPSRRRPPDGPAQPLHHKQGGMRWRPIRPSTAILRSACWASCRTAGYCRSASIH
jgi:hypothetical protein